MNNPIFLRSININHYRSIENITINIPNGKPLVLFGPNNAGKSNILNAINRLLGDRYPTYIEMLDSDYFMRDGNKYPESTITAEFTEPLYHDNNNNGYDKIAITYGVLNRNNHREPLLHDGNSKKLYISNDDRAKCQSVLIDAERNIQTAFNYSSSYSLLSKFSKRIHQALSDTTKDKLSNAFQEIKNGFEETNEYKKFFNLFKNNINNSVKGFVHSLDVDFSAYDPNNYAKSMRIYAKEGSSIRSFEEFGTGEQQVLLMAFIKSYMETFNDGNFILIIEEPEAHLHPLAQKWLREYIENICKSGVQVIISTHSLDLIDLQNLDGIVRVYKENGVTKTCQISNNDLYSMCLQSGIAEDKISKENVIEYFSTKMNNEQLRGLFADTVMLVEGATEFYSLPIWLRKVNFSLAERGIEIVNCGSKYSIPLFYRLYRFYNFNCYIVFDNDENKDMKTTKTFKGIFDNILSQNIDEGYFVGKDIAFFDKNYESYMKEAIYNYSELENSIKEKYSLDGKPGVAKIIAQESETIPNFVKDLSEALKTIT